MKITSPLLGPERLTSCGQKLDYNNTLKALWTESLTPDKI